MSLNCKTHHVDERINVSKSSYYFYNTSINTESRYGIINIEIVCSSYLQKISRICQIIQQTNKNKIIKINLFH